MIVGLPVAALAVAGTPDADTGTPPENTGRGGGAFAPLATSVASGRVAISGRGRTSTIPRNFVINSRGGTRGEVAVRGAGAGSLGTIAAATQAKVDNTGRASASLGTLSSAASAVVSLSGTASGRIDGLRGTATGRLPLTGSGTARLGVLGAQGSGEGAQEDFGTGQARFTLAGSAMGRLSVAGTSASRFAGLRSTGYGRVLVRGSGQVVLAARGWSSADVPALGAGAVRWTLGAAAVATSPVRGRASVAFALASAATVELITPDPFPPTHNVTRRSVLTDDRSSVERMAQRRVFEIHNRYSEAGGTMHDDNQWPDKPAAAVLDYEIEWSGCWRDDDFVESVEHTVVKGSVRILQESVMALPPRTTITGTVVWLDRGVVGEEVEIISRITTDKGRVIPAVRRFRIK